MNKCSTLRFRDESRCLFKYSGFLVRCKLFYEIIHPVFCNKVMKKILSISGVFVMIFFISGCRSTSEVPGPVDEYLESTGARPVSLSPNEVRLKVSSLFSYSRPDIPARVYVFPPLRMDSSFNTVGTYVPKKDTNGMVVDWTTPLPYSRKVRLLLESFLVDRGFRVLSFQQTLEIKKDYAVLVVMPSISKVRIIQRKNHKPELITFLVSLHGFTFPANMDAEKRKSVFTQNIGICCRANDPFESVVSVALESAVRSIGKTEAYDDFVFIKPN